MSPSCPLIEPEGSRWSEYQWPYGNLYAIYREEVQRGQIDRLGLWYNNLPPGQRAACYLSPIQALPLVSTKLVRPAVSIAGKRIVFPVEIESGCYLECNSADDCQLYGPQGQLLRSVVPEGKIPSLEAVANEVRFECSASAGASPRANVTVISFGDPLK